VGNYWIKAKGFKQCSSIATAVLAYSYIDHGYSSNNMPSSMDNDLDFEKRDVEGLVAFYFTFTVAFTV